MALARRPRQILSGQRLRPMKRSPARKLFRPAVLCCLLTVAATSSSCVKLSRRARAGVAATQKELPTGASAAPRVDLNAATREELEKLPGVGPALAARVVEHRERQGSFRRAEHLIIVRGFSERRFRQLRDLVEVK